MKVITVNACVYCGRKAKGNYSIHRDGFGVGPEVPLCDDCGSDRTPTTSQIWGRVAMVVDHSFAFYRYRVTG